MPGLAVLALFAAAVPTAVVLQPVANMYSHPSTDADVVSQTIFGANVAILEQKDGWAHVRTADDYTGWTPLSALLPGKPYAGGGRVAEVQSLFAHIYRESNVTTHAPLLTLPFESRLEVVAKPAAEPNEAARWLQVRLPDDRAAWVQAADVSLHPQPLSIAETVEFAKRFLGLPYTWGGTSSYGYDCSGFSQMLARRRGVTLPRDAQPQADWSGVSSVDRRRAWDQQPGLRDLRPGRHGFQHPDDLPVPAPATAVQTPPVDPGRTQRSPSMKILAIIAVAFAILYNVVVKAAVFLFCTFVIALATIGLYDLVILPFRKIQRVGERRAS